jgi:hypothetical protein
MSLLPTTTMALWLILDISSLAISSANAGSSVLTVSPDASGMIHNPSSFIGMARRVLRKNTLPSRSMA